MQAARGGPPSNSPRYATGVSECIKVNEIKCNLKPRVISMKMKIQLFTYGHIVIVKGTYSTKLAITSYLFTNTRVWFFVRIQFYAVSGTARMVNVASLFYYATITQIT